MEFLDKVNGGGWVVFIATNHFLPVAHFLPIADGPRFWPRPCTSTTEIGTDNSNDYINGYKCIKCVVRCQIKQSRTVRPCTPDSLQ
jgi:hypothetical protein